jgi:PilZ domain-containing protein
MDKRRYPRIPFQAPAFVISDGKPVMSQVRNISNNGLFVNTRACYEKDESALVAIYFLQKNITLSVTLPCTVARRDDEGIGFVSQAMDPETLLFISNLLHVKHGKSTELMASFYSYLIEHDSSPPVHHLSFFSQG